MVFSRRSDRETNRGRFAVRARYLFPVDAPPMRDGCLTIDDGMIVAVGATDAAHVVDLGQVAVLPGLINAHTHLEFSQLDAPLGTPAMSFPDWIRRVIGWRAAQRGDGSAQRGDGSAQRGDGSAQRGDGSADEWRNRAIRAGILESERAGVTMLGEIATLPVLPIDRYQEFSGIAFLELLGLRDETHDALMAAAEQFVANSHSLPSGRPGLSPHAPYTVSPKLLARVVELSSREQLPVAMHLAETREELELLRDASGPLQALLGDLGAWQADAIPLRSRPMNYLELLAQAYRSLVVHGNYLTADEIAFVAQRRDRMSIVYCPRTHAYFDHARYPLVEMLEAGARVAVGTDSRASNPDLNVLDELRFVARTHPGVAPQAVMRMATLDAAIAMGVDDCRGSLSVGKYADFVTLPVTDGEPADPYDLVLGSTEGVSGVYRSGTRKR